MSLISVPLITPMGWIFSTPSGYNVLMIINDGSPWAETMVNTYPDVDTGREIVQMFTELLRELFPSDLVSRQVNETDSRHFLATDGFQNFRAELCTGIGHRESRRASAIFCLDDFVTTELNAIYEGSVFIL